MAAGTPPGLAFRPPAVSNPTASLFSLGSICSWTRDRSAAAAGRELRGHLRTTVSAAEHLLPLTLRFRPRIPRTRPSLRPQQPSTAHCRASQDPPSPLTAPDATGRRPALRKVSPLLEPSVSRPTSSTCTASPRTLRLPEPAVEPDDGHHLRSCVGR